MKKIKWYPGILMSLFISLNMHYASAQIFKKLVNSIKQNTQNKASDSLQKQNAANQTSAVDTSSANKVLNAFAKAAKDNPNDTSSADLTMKALSNLAGGGGVSSADSAAAIRSFKTASGGNGFYYETSVTVMTKERGTITSKSKSYFDASGEARTEFDMGAMMGVQNGTPLIGISHAGKPRYSVFLDDRTKTYSLNVIDTSLINGANQTFSVTRIGNETVLGYPCVHSRLTIASKDRTKPSTTMEVWTSAAVPGYSNLKKMISAQNVTSGMIQALDRAGCSGYFVKITSERKDYSMTMSLASAESRTFPADLFKIPEGYTAAKGNLMFNNMMQSAQKKP